MAEAKTVLVKHSVTGSTCRMAVEAYNKAIEDAEEVGLECPWAVADEDGQDAPTFDDLDKAGQKKVLENQAERQKKFDAKQAAK